MEMKAIFTNGECKLVLTPANDWEKKLLGALAQGQDSLDTEVVYKSSGHISYGNCQVIEVTLRADKIEEGKHYVVDPIEIKRQDAIYDRMHEGPP